MTTNTFVLAAWDYLDFVECSDLEKRVLTYLVENHVGKKNAVSLAKLELRFNVSRETIQNRVILPSRKLSHFIGSCSKGIFIIDSEEDARDMVDFYTTRIAQETYHMNRLRDLAGV